jgi:hypothetical protein
MHPTTNWSTQPQHCAPAYLIESNRDPIVEKTEACWMERPSNLNMRGS